MERYQQRLEFSPDDNWWTVRMGDVPHLEYATQHIVDRETYLEEIAEFGEYLR